MNCQSACQQQSASIMIHVFFWEFLGNVFFTSTVIAQNAFEIMVYGILSLYLWAFDKSQFKISYVTVVESCEGFNWISLFFPSSSCSCSITTVTKPLKLWRAVVILPIARSAQDWETTACRMYLIILLSERKFAGLWGVRGFLCSTMFESPVASSSIPWSNMNFSKDSIWRSIRETKRRVSESY